MISHARRQTSCLPRTAEDTNACDPRRFIPRVKHSIATYWGLWATKCFVKITQDRFDTLGSWQKSQGRENESFVAGR